MVDAYIPRLPRLTTSGVGAGGDLVDVVATDSALVAAAVDPAAVIGARVACVDVTRASP